jgi:hypothetical protein
MRGGCEDVEECRGESGGTDGYRELFEDRREGEFVFNEAKEDDERSLYNLRSKLLPLCRKPFFFVRS